jgi:hypothetical protein
MPVHDELVMTLEQLRCELEELAIRGLRAATSRQRGRLQQIREELEGSGAAHLAGAIGRLGEALEQDDPAAGAALFRAQTALRVFERLLTLEVVQAQLDEWTTPGDSAQPETPQPDDEREE